MGCDIHLHTEVKINGKWEHYSNPDIPRNYPLFAYMADVRNRNNIHPISTPRGLPEDCSVVTKIDSDDRGSDEHSHSFLLSGEIALVGDFLGDRMQGIFGYLFGYEWVDFKGNPEVFPPTLEDIRWVFWFDN